LATPPATSTSTDPATVGTGQIEALCPSCGYDLRGLPPASERCPECGTPIDRLRPSVLPWPQRGQIGRRRAYLRTLWLATFGTRRLATEIARPVNFADAQRFRWMTVILAWLPLAVIATVFEDLGARQFATIAGGTGMMFSSMSAGMRPMPGVALDSLVLWIAAAALYVPIPLCLLLFVLAISGVASYWFHPRGISVVRQNRAIVLSYYACAPLALLIVPLLLAAGAIAVAAGDSMDSTAGFRAYVALLLGFLATLIAVLCLWWVATIRLLRRTTDSSGARTWAAGLLLPVTWLAIGALTLIVVPCVIGFVALLITTLRS
jgi:hypothetical protein